MIDTVVPWGELALVCVWCVVVAIDKAIAMYKYSSRYTYKIQYVLRSNNRVTRG